MRNFKYEDYSVDSAPKKKSRKQLAQKPKYTFSVIIPTYREEKILDSILRLYTQELRDKYNFELIVSDGGSKDSTLDIAQKYADKVITHTEERRQTIGEGRNKGAEAAEGEILIFINADTYPADFTSFFKAAEEFAATGEDQIALACRCRGIPEEEKTIDKVFYGIHNPIIKFGTMIGLGYGRGECQVIKKEAFNLVGGYDETVHAGEDFDLYGRLTKIGRIKYEPEIFVYESTRRFRKFGYLRVLSLWAINALTVKFKGKSMSDDWEAVR
jgi:glycosyltransferase involved in cell wall biosynthesis